MTDVPHSLEPNDESDVVALRTLATRLLEMQYPLVDQAPLHLLLGQVAPEFPAEVPLPEGSHVLGSLVGKRRVIVLFDVDLPLERFDAFYRERLPALGWSVAEQPGGQRGGFAHTRRPPGPPSVGALFCHGEAGPGMVTHASQPDGVPSGRIQASLALVHYDKPHESPCSQRFRERMGPGRMWDALFPMLQPPHGGVQEGGGGGGGGNHYSMTATLDVADLDAATVGRHYRDQLRQAGWNLVDEGAVSPAAWSTWTFTDDQDVAWTALFYALRHPAMPERYLLTLRADLPESSGPGM
jgi:hypothetical protein